MAAISTKMTLKHLKKKGFFEIAGDHRYLEYIHGGRVILFTKISHGSKKDLDDYLIKQMSTQCHLDKKQFIDLAKCDLKKEEYFTILQQKGLVP